MFILGGSGIYGVIPILLLQQGGLGRDAVYLK